METDGRRAEVTDLAAGSAPTTGGDPKKGTGEMSGTEIGNELGSGAMAREETTDPDGTPVTAATVGGTMTVHAGLPPLGINL